MVLFTGRSRCVRVQASWGVQKLAEPVSKVSEVPTQKFYLTCDGMPLQGQDDLRKVTPHRRVLMRGRLVGGARTIILGEWSCAVCGAQGCWPTRRSCYKNSSLKTATAVQLGAFISGYKGHFRGTEWYWAPYPSPCPCPGTCSGGGATKTYQKSKESGQAA